MAGHYLIPLTPSENIVDFGDIKLFCDDGLVALGNACFDRFSTITDHKFSGCVANRDESRVLVITTPVETLEYQYKAALETWYQRVPDKSTDSPTFPVGHIREALGDYGIIGGPIVLIIEAFCWLVGLFIKLFAFLAILAMVGVSIWAVGRSLLYHFFGIGSPW